MEDRYSRQKQVATFGIEGQEALQTTSVLVVGCGGLGCPVSMYLSRAGVLKFGLVDADTVHISNLHRQVLFSESDVGRLKVDAAKEALLSGNSSLKITTYQARLDSNNYHEIMSGFDIIIDCSDNFETRYLVNDACVLLNKPLIYGAANQLEGQVAVFNHNGSGNLRDLFPELPKEGTIQNCAEAGVLGVITGIIGDLMALEAIKVITGVGEPLTNSLTQFDGSSSRLLTFSYKPNIETNKFEIVVPPFKKVTWSEVKKLTGCQLVDVRTTAERVEENYGGIHMPLNSFESRMMELNNEQIVAFYCKTGSRAQQAALKWFEITKKESLVIVGSLPE